MSSETLVVQVEEAKARSDVLEQHVRDICKTMRFSDTGASRALGHMHYDDERKVIYCFIPKVSDGLLKGRNGYRGKVDSMRKIGGTVTRAQVMRRKAKCL